jgi:hypothetical protein
MASPNNVPDKGCSFQRHVLGPRPVLAILPTGAGSNRGKITVKVVFACTCTRSSWPSAVVLRLHTALTVILLGFKNDRAGRMALFAYAWRGCGAQLTRRVPWGPYRRPPPWLLH